jgi:hypothetical protein
MSNLMLGWVMKSLKLQQQQQPATQFALLKKEKTQEKVYSSSAISQVAALFCC